MNDRCRSLWRHCPKCVWHEGDLTANTALAPKTWLKLSIVRIVKMRLLIKPTPLGTARKTTLPTRRGYYFFFGLTNYILYWRELKKISCHSRTTILMKQLSVFSYNNISIILNHLIYVILKYYVDFGRNNLTKLFAEGNVKTRLNKLSPFCFRWKYRVETLR